MHAPLLSAESITKAFAGVHALQGVSLDLRAGEVHALVGENGAGKSTLIKIITGAESPDAGTLTVDGRIVRRMDPSEARRRGIAAIYQQPALFPDLTVAENIALSLERGAAWRRVDWRARAGRAADLLARVGASIDPERLAGTLSLPEQQIVEIAKAIGADARILIMDEPTASLTPHEVAHFFDLIRRLREHGAAIVYISHRLDEVLALADRVTVLRDGRVIATQARHDVTRADLIRLMAGRAETAAAGPARRVADDVVLELRGVSQRAAGLHDVSLAVRGGEIVGVAGLVGSGRTELAETIFGLTPLDGGEIRLRGAVVRVQSPADAIRLGIAHVPEDRPQHGVVLDMSVAANMTLADLPSVSRAGILDRGAERERARRETASLRIKAPSPEADVRTLSGGNQQKVALARWLALDPAVLVLDEPTQGVDVASKAEIHDIVRGLAERGVAVVMMSSELPEVLALSDRIAVMRGGTVVGVLDRAEVTAPRLLALAFGEDPASHAASEDPAT